MVICNDNYVAFFFLSGVLNPMEKNKDKTKTSSALFTPPTPIFVWLAWSWPPCPSSSPLTPCSRRCSLTTFPEGLLPLPSHHTVHFLLLHFCNLKKIQSFTCLLSVFPTACKLHKAGVLSCSLFLPQIHWVIHECFSKESQSKGVSSVGDYYMATISLIPTISISEMSNSFSFPIAPIPPPQAIAI